MSPEMIKIRSLRIRAVDVPMARPLHTGGGAVTSAPLALIDLETDQGVIGRSYLFCYAGLALKPMVELLRNLDPVIRGDELAPLAIEAKLQRTFRLLGPQGFTGMALAGIDMAAWDALAIANGQPLCRLLGAVPTAVPAYNSNGLGLIGAAKAGREGQELAAGFSAIKVRLGYADPADDIAVVRAVRGAVPDGTQLMSDYNQCLSPAEAERRIAALEDEGLAWIEEPVRWDDFAGQARVRAKSRIAIQIGESFWGPHDMARAIAAGACDYVMPDAMKIGGVTGWLRAVALAEAAGLPVSSHLYPEISVHLLAAAPTRHWLEYVDWANPILAEPLSLEDGRASAPERPGSGIAWDDKAIARYAV